ncbi:MAG: glycosyltransferase family 2 protein [Deltaproteobacteria bacterium]|nr:glycosyltransferase family 2 protein [Deltaproteobacteria bacterium]
MSAAQQTEAPPGGAPRVQVLLSTHNGARFLREQLDSIFAQDWPALSLKVRDDGSSDDTRAILSEYQAAGRLQAEFGPRLGALRSFARLLENADADCGYFAFSDQDDVWRPGKIRRAVHCLEAAAAERRSPLPLLYGCRSTITDAALRPRGLTPLPRRGLSFANALVESVLPGSTMLMNRAARAKIVEHGIPGEAIDHDWWCYLAVSATGRIIYDPAPQRLYRQHGGNLTGQPASAAARLARKLRVVGSLRAGAVRRLISQARAFQARFGGELSPKDRLRLARLCDCRTPRATLRCLLGRSVQRQSALDSLALTLLLLFSTFPQAAWRSGAAK